MFKKKQKTLTNHCKLL